MSGAGQGGQRQRKVLVTGGTGLLGRPLLEELVRRGFAVTSISSRKLEKVHPETRELLERCKIPHISLDLALDVESTRAVGLACMIEEFGFDLVINLAADRGGVAWDGVKKKMDNFVLNTELPACLAEIATRQSVHVFHISTEYVWSGDGNTEEGYPPVSIGEDPRFVGDKGAAYAIQKKAAEERVKGNPWITVIRLPVLFGPMVSELEDGTAGSSICNFLADNDWKHDTWQMRYPTSTVDTAFVLAALAQRLFRTGLKSRVYHYGAQRSCSKYEFMRLFSRATNLSALGRPIASEDAAQRPDGKRPPYNVKLDISAMREELSAYGDWREPRNIDSGDVKDVWLHVPFFKEAVAQLRQSAGEGEATMTTMVVVQSDDEQEEDQPPAVTHRRSQPPEPGY